jgi:hypothetical protein
MLHFNSGEQSKIKRKRKEGIGVNVPSPFLNPLKLQKMPSGQI